MKVEQIYDIVNIITSEALGVSNVVQEDLSNIVDVGAQLANLSASAYENYVRSLVDHIGRVVFVNRPYGGSAPRVLMDAWEYGSILEKITAAMPEATENQSWELNDGYVYEQDKFTKPQVTAKFFNSKTTFEIPMSFAERQAKSAFDSASQLNAFFSMIDTQIYNSKTVKLDELIMRTINNMIGMTFYDERSSGTYTGWSGVKCVNLLYLYNQQYSSSPIYDLATAMATGDFIRFASYTMGRYEYRMRKLSTLFNIGNQPRFTPSDRLHFVMLNDFAKAANVYNQSDTFHEQFTALPNAELVPYWQGTGTSYSLSDITTINIKANDGSGTSRAINATGILGVMFDRDALGVCNKDSRVTTHYNARAEFYNNWYKEDASYFNDGNENFVVFYAADTAGN